MFSMLKRMVWSALASAVLFGVGLAFAMSIPGGGDVTDQDFTDFYDSDGKKAVALLGMAMLVASVVTLLWFLIEFRTALGAQAASTGAQLGHALAGVSVPLIAAGAAILGGALGADMNGYDGGFVGVPVALTAAQSGLGVALGVGAYPLAVAVILLSVAARRAGSLSKVASMAGIVAGVLMFASFIAVGLFAFPLWLLVVAFTGFRPSPAA